MAGNTPILLGKKSQEGIIEFLKQCCQLSGQQWNLREQLRQNDLAYMRELDYSSDQIRAQLSNQLGDPKRFQNITVPVIMPATEEAVVYQSSVFLTGNPLFGVVSAPANIDAALQLETIIDNQAVRGGWIRHLNLFFRDGFKYNLSFIEANWDSETTFVAETSPDFAVQAKQKEVIWSGNCLKRLDPYNTFFDTRVIPAELPKKGEYTGYTELYSRIALKQFIATLPEKRVENLKTAFESGFQGVSDGDVSSYYIPQLNRQAKVDQKTNYSTNWLAWAGIAAKDSSALDIDYKDLYQVTTLYARILPIDFGISVPSRSTPQIWKFIIVNNQVIIYAERQTNIHNLIPIFMGQPLEDGLGYQTKSFAENVRPMQDFSTAMMNSVVAARRKAIHDRVIYDPLRISEANINSQNPSAKIPVRPAAYGKPLSEAVYAFPFNDNNSAEVMGMLPTFMTTFPNLITGQNQARRGQFTKGNRTRHEYEDIMQNSSGRDQMCSILYESQVFTPIKNVIKSNILQYQGVGDIYNRAKGKVVTIDPTLLRKTILEFKLSDGLIPTDKLIGADTLKVAFQVIGSSPQINSQYNIAPLFSYLMKIGGADITPFEKSPEQVAYEQAMAQYQQMLQYALDQKATPQQIAAIPKPDPKQFNYNPAVQGISTPGPDLQTKILNIVRNDVNTGI